MREGVSHRIPKPEKSSKKYYQKKLIQAQNEANEWKRRCKLLGGKYLEEIQKARLSIEMFKNEVLGTHKDMQMRFIDELVIAHK